MSPAPTEPTTTHVCPASDNKIMPGKGAKGTGADRCRPCFEAYMAEIRARKKAAKARVSRVGLNRGNLVVRHGFYRKNLEPDEVKLAEELHAEFCAKYELDSVADELLLTVAVENFVKSRRIPPPPDPRDKAPVDYQGRYERNFKEAIQALALDRKTRRDENKKEDIVAQMSALFPKKAAELARDSQRPAGT